MTAETVGSEQTRVMFTGRRAELFGRLLLGYLLMVPTLGIYRFWVTTVKRRFYWQNTVIDGDALEYSGRALQLLIGFLFAVAFFLPLYIAFFYFSTQSSLTALIGYGGVGAVLWFLTGYAQYRGRDFRLSRTLWRGVRFDQQGNAWAYALRRFLWTIAVLATAGLVYPLMAASLWKYRYTHTRFGDRAFSFAGSWKTVAGPFYKAYGAVVVMVIVFVMLARTSGSFEFAIGFGPLAILLTIGLAFLYYRSRESSRMFSSVRLGDASVTVRVKARALLGQYLLYLVMVLVALLLIGMLAMAIYLNVLQDALPRRGVTSAVQLAQSGLAGGAAVISGYLAVFASFALMGEIFLDFGYWKLVAQGAMIVNARSLRTVAAIAEDKALVGEGLADALNVGSF